METREAVQRLILVEPKRVYDLHESAINVVVPRIADDAVADARGGVGPGAPGGGVARARESPRPVSGGRRGVPVRRIPGRGRALFGVKCRAIFMHHGHFAEVPRHCLTRVLRASRLCVPPTAPMGMAPRSRVAARAGRGVHPHPDHFLGSGRSNEISNVALPCAGSRYNKYKTARVLRGSAPAN